jgi:DNA-binding transcriptional regulator YiaG
MKTKIQRRPGGKQPRTHSMPATDFIAARNRLGLTQAEMGKLLGSGLRTIQHWEHGTRGIPKAVVMLLGYILRDHETVNDVSEKISYET